MEADDLSAVLERVCDEATFVDLLIALRNDREQSVEEEEKNPSSPFGPDARGWENTTIEAFFDASIRYATDSCQSRVLHRQAQNPWRRCAEILLAAKAYE